MVKENGKKRRGLSVRRFLIFILGLSILLAVITFELDYSSKYIGKVKEHVTIEAGSVISLDLFTDDLENVKPAYDFSKIDTSLLGTYPIPFCCDNRRYVCDLTIVDTIPPIGETQNLVTDVFDLPDVSEFVVSYSDITPVKIDFEQEPDVSIGGIKDGSVAFTDIAGNKTIVPIQVRVIDDFEAPFFYGVKPIEIYENDIIKYRDGITIVDNMDPHPVLSIDNSQVDVTKPGKYTVTYTGTDATGNSRSLKTTVTVVEKPEGYVEPEEIYILAERYLNQITDNSMSDIEKCFKVYYWCKANINYIGTSDKSHWTIGAYEGFSTLAGDCFTYAACAKAMFDLIGVDSYIIERCDPTTSTHFWNLIEIDGQWYFCDCSRTNTPMNAFCLTDSELHELTYTHGNRYNFDPSGLPNRATESIQYKLNYSTLTVKED